MWSWDLTKLPGPGRHECYELYAVIDIFSRYVPGWLVAPAESAELAEALIADTIARNGAAPRSPHADRGSMTSKPVAQLLSTWVWRAATAALTCPTTILTARPPSRL